MDIDLQEGENKPQPGKVVRKKKPLKQKIRELKERITKFFQNPKKRLIFEICLGLVLIAIFGLGLGFLTRSGGASILSTDKVVVPAAPAITYSSILDGVLVTDQAAANQHPLAITVENDPAARPQSGLGKASIVYEAVYDPAATTRFLAIFGENEATKVGPVRSARTFFVDWAHGYDAYLAHWGGNMDALDQIKKDKIFDLDEFAYASLYWREGKGSTEHTGYTSTAKLREQAAKNNYSTANNFNVYQFKDDSATLPESQKITVDYSSAQYRVDFTYDKVTNSYKRSIASSADKDAVTKEQLAPKNIAIMTVARKQTTTRINESGYTMTTVGTGKARIFMDGKEISGTWKKDSAGEREVFYDDAGNEVVFNRGQLWICVVAENKVVTVE